MTLPIALYVFHWSRFQIEVLSVWTMVASIGLLALLARVPRAHQARLGWASLLAVGLQTMSIGAVFFETLW